MDFERARFNMIEQQIRPWSVLDQEVLDLLSVVHREDFVPPAYRTMAFSDLEVPLVVGGRATGETMLSPKVEARLLQELGVRRHETVLEIGAGSGHMAALLAQRARHVDTLEIDPDLARFARANLERAGIANVAVREADGADPSQTTGTYDVILLSGGVPEVPAHLLARLAPGGRLAAMVGEAPVMTATRITRGANGGTSSAPLFDTLARPLRGFARGSRFRF